MSLPKLQAKAQIIFNAYIRKRDEGLPCISCGQYKVLQAGHYVPVKGGSRFRYDEFNVNGECAGCNGFDEFHLIGYRKNLINKIGIDMVEFLDENRRDVKKWSRSELLEIIEKYK